MTHDGENNYMIYPKCIVILSKIIQNETPREPEIGWPE
jgi:hypothetical protein